MIFFSFTDSNTGAVGIDIKFAKELAGDYQLIAYATYPKVAVISTIQEIVNLLTPKCKKKHAWIQQ